MRERDGMRLSRVSLHYAEEARPRLVRFVLGGVAICHADEDGGFRLSVHKVRGGYVYGTTRLTVVVGRDLKSGLTVTVTDFSAWGIPRTGVSTRQT